MPRQGVKQKWSPEEEQALRAGVARYGVGKWRLIQKDEEFAETLSIRSNVDLKDKWRNLNMEMGGARGDRRLVRSSEVRREGHRRKRKRRPERAPESVDPAPNGLHALHAAATRPQPHMTTRRQSHARSRHDSTPAADAEEAELDDDDDPDVDPDHDHDDNDDMDEEDAPAPLHGDIITTAIIALRDPSGSHAEDIMKWIEAHYGSAMQLRTNIKATLRGMVEAGRLERVPEQPSLYRLGGVMRHFAMDADHADARPARRAKRRADPQAQLHAAEIAAAAVREAEEAAAVALQLEAEEAHHRRSLSLPLEAMSGLHDRDASLEPALPANAVHLSQSTPDLAPLGQPPGVPVVGRGLATAPSHESSPLLPSAPALAPSELPEILPLHDHTLGSGGSPMRLAALSDYATINDQI